MNLLIDYLLDGQLAIYECEVTSYYRQLDDESWEFFRSLSPRVIVNLELDCPLTTLVDRLPIYLQDLKDVVRTKELVGTLIFSIRFCSRDPHLIWIDSDKNPILDRHNTYVAGGLAFIEGTSNIPNSFDTGNQGPIPFIEQFCQAVADPLFPRDNLLPEVINLLQLNTAKQEKAKFQQLLVKSKARTILLEHLNETQRKEFEASDEFQVRGKDGYDYLITDGYMHNVFRLENGKRTQEYCIVSKDIIPNYDQLLAQLLLLRANPELFHKIANTWTLEEDGSKVFLRKGTSIEL